MTELAILEKRRQLVTLSCDLQRATLSRRLTAIEQRPRLAAFGVLASIGSRPGVRKLVLALAVMGFRAWRRRRSRH